MLVRSDDWKWKTHRERAAYRKLLLKRNDLCQVGEHQNVYPRNCRAAAKMIFVVRILVEFISDKHADDEWSLASFGFIIVCLGIVDCNHHRRQRERVPPTQRRGRQTLCNTLCVARCDISLTNERMKKCNFSCSNLVYSHSYVNFSEFTRKKDIHPPTTVACSLSMLFCRVADDDKTKKKEPSENIHF